MLYISLLLSVLFYNGLAVNIMRASFYDSGSEVQGNVTVQDSTITIALNLETIITNGNLPSGCDTSQGFLFHVHTAWTHENGTDYYGDNCASTFTDLHYDPFAACGSKSANSDCKTNGGCINDTYSCTASDYIKDAYSCEVGDWSGKYGTLFLSETNLTGEFKSFGEITGDQLAGKSLVFHCASNKVAAFCAKFLPVAGVSAGSQPKQSSGFSLKADFGTALGLTGNKRAYITLDYNGQGFYRFDKGTFANLVTPCASKKYKAWVSNLWSSALDSESAACVSSIYGQFHDPTHQCYSGVNDTDSKYCFSGELCDNDNYTYACNYSVDPFSCSPMDLSGRYGLIDGNTISSTGISKPIVDKYMADLTALPHKSIVLVCAETHVPVLCAKIQNIGIGTSVALFQNGANGFVSVKDGEVTVDLTNVNKSLNVSSLLPSDCFTNGAYIHIHEKWAYSDTADRSGPVACNASYTGGHWDPWFACGPATGNTAVCKLTPSPSPACVEKTYTCNSANYSANPFACEVGDWSGKYGIYKVIGNAIDRKNHSYMEVDSTSVIGRSVVIHCSSTGGKRAICAPFQLQNNLKDGEDTEPTYSLQDQAGNLIYNASVELANNSGEIFLRNTGAYYVNLDLSSDTQCSSTISYGVFEDSSCQNLYDPTIQCPPKSQYAATLCIDGKTCNKTSEYNCLITKDQYSCSPSDLSGRYGKTGTDKKLGSSGWDDLMIPLVQLRTRYFGVFCSDTLTDIGCYAWNVNVQATPNPTMSPSPAPTNTPTLPTKAPTPSPTNPPTKKPTQQPTNFPTLEPTDFPSMEPTLPTPKPTMNPSQSPSHGPTMHPVNITIELNTTMLEESSSVVQTTTQVAKSVNRVAVGAGMWFALLGLLWI